MSKLIWTKTGDVIDLVVTNREVYDYFVANLNSHGINRYAMVDFGYKLFRDELLEKHKLFQTFVQTRLKSDAFDFDVDPNNQSDLNKLHREWVKFHQRYPNIGLLFDKSVIDRINKLIHRIEELPQVFIIDTPEPNTCFTNKFGPSILDHGIWNLSIEYNSLGRSSYNKWNNGDPVSDSDTNNFEEFYTQLKVRVVPSEQHPLPVEYQTWCKRYGLACVGSCLPLANFDNMEQNLLKYRQLVLANSLIENNFIILE